MPDAARWPRIREVFHAALDHAAGERAAFLDTACAGDLDLRREVESLLAAQVAAGAFLSEPIASVVSPALEGRRIGPYRVLGEIGHGGMGFVYRAVRDDDVFKKTVALKLAHEGASPEHLRRIGQERQILARLQHPNIAMILDGGATEEGQPYLVMEYVEGTPVDAHCDARGLATRERLELFRTVCGAVHYAHQNLVVHRDLKPPNILVTPDGQPKLLDFGIAKLLSGAEPGEAPTLTLTPMMTLEYASPEQVRGLPVTTGTDVYSLGVILYELLTGRRPFVRHTDSLEELVRALCETEPMAPSAARRTGAPGARRPASPRELKGDLDTIVLKALRKEPERRYLSAQDLAEDVRRYLEGRPVFARGDTPGYRMSKFVGRHRVGVAAATLVAASLVAGMEMRAGQARLAEANRLRAERRFADVRKMANSFLFEVHDAIAPLAGSTAARKLVVQRALEYLDSLAAEAHGDVSLQRELAEAYKRVGDVQGGSSNANLGDTAGAIASYRKAIALYGTVAPAEDPAPAPLLETMRFLSLTQLAAGDQPGAYLTAMRAAALSRAAVATGRRDLDHRRQLTSCLLVLGNVATQAGHAAAAEGAVRESVQLLQALHDEVPDDTRVEVNLALGLWRLGWASEARGDREGALRYYQQSEVIRSGLLTGAPENAQYKRTLVFSREAIGRLLPDVSGAEPVLRSAVALARELAQADPRDADARLNLARVEKELGLALGRAGRTAEGLRLIDGTTAFARQAVSADPGNFNLRVLLGESYWARSVVHASQADRVNDAPRRLTALREELDWLKRSQSVWLELRSAGKLSGPSQATQADVEARIAAAEKKIAAIRLAL